MEQLITKQSTDGKAIQKMLLNFRKDSTQRKTKEYCAARLQSLNNAWETFEKRNAELEPFKSQTPQHKYFEDDFYSRVETLYEEGRELMENAIRDAIERTKNTERIENQLRNIKKQTALIDTLQGALRKIKAEITTQTSTAFFTQKTKLLNDYWDHIVVNHGEIMSTGKFKDDYFDNDVFTKTEDEYQAVLINLQDKLNKLTSPQSPRRNITTETNPREVQSLKSFLEFIESRFQGLEAIEPKRLTNNKLPERRDRNMKIHHSAINRQGCSICKAEHKIYGCEKFSKLSIQQRIDAVRKLKLCANCLMKGHASAGCKSWRVCKICNKKHHTLLHLKLPNQGSASSPNPISCGEKLTINNQPTELMTHIASNKVQHTVLLATALIQAFDRDGNCIQLRALVDQGAQGTFITEDAAQRLRLPRVKISATVTGVGEANVGTIQTCLELTFKPRFASMFSLTTTALILKRLTKIMPSESIIPNSWKHTKNLVLADPRYDMPGRIDVILGADIVGKILLDNVLRGEPGSPVAQQTELGWILSGEISTATTNKTIQCFISDVDISNELRRFWESEALQHEQVLTSDDVACETHYRATHRRGSDGRYTVRIPFREDPEKTDNLDGSRQLALARLFQMERKFKTNISFATMYKDFMKEYLRLGHMVPASDNIEGAYYLPHHAVLKQDSTTTKLRVVFDASAKRHSAKSINELMMTGPQLQQGLFSILLRWRKHKFVFTADIEKMYRQIKVDIRDQNFQCILWRESPAEPVREFKLTTVTYGTASAPFLAIRTLQQLAKDDEHTYPAAAKIIMHDTYVDDIVSGGNSLNEIIESSDQLIKLLNGAGFNLRKWSSNNKDLLQKIPRELRESVCELDFDKDNTIKALGVHWNPSTDNFKIQVNINTETIPSTKRELLSEAAKIFDPIGFLAPVTIKIKLLFQELWLEGSNWDEKLPMEILQKWGRIKTELPRLQAISISRWIGYTGQDCKCELHGFSDASEAAYGAVIYLRVIHGGRISTSLVTAKTKVAPLKSKLSIPRLELCAATLLANLIKDVRESLNIENIKCYAWTDSTIVLAWIQENPHKWKTFVGNRVAEIQAITNSKNWFHVKSQENPADLASRGVYPSHLKGIKLWWEGPEWLKTEAITFPQRELPDVIQERKRVIVNIITNEGEETLTLLLQRYSSLGKLQRVLAYCNRFINNIRVTKALRNFEPLTIDELDKSLVRAIKFTQNSHFKEEISSLLRGQELHKASRIFTLSPFLDKYQLLRVGGRLENTDMPYEQKHPIILPYKCELTSLVIDKAHKESHHGGNSLTLEITRQRYWILNGPKAIKGHIHKCIKCHRYKAQMSQQMMGMLPTARVVPSPPFTHTGVDYAGPIELLISRRRGSRTHKGYLSIFICLTSKAIHIEVVTDLTAKAFIAAFKRFTSRRGKVAHLYSDNATNFVGASKIISDLHKLDSYKTNVNNALQEAGTQWHFIPPASPHFGGLWEAGVKSIKYHMRRVIGETTLTYEEMCTLMTQIEACLNSRPLCPLSEDPESLEVLTPGHFLRGSAILTTPGRDLLDANPNLLDRWDRVERMKQEFWRKWSVEYLGRLQYRPKWTQKQEDIRKGNLVLIKDEQMPPESSRRTLELMVELEL